MRKAFDLRPVEFGDIMSRSFSLYVANFRLFAGLFLLFVFVPTALIELGKFAFVSASAKPPPSSGRTIDDPFTAYVDVFLFVLRIVLTWAVAGSGIYYLVSRVYLGAKTTIGESIRAVLSHSGMLIGTGLIVLVAACVLVGVCAVPMIVGLSDFNARGGGTFMIGVMLAFLAIPLALFLFGRYGLVFCAVMLEDMGPDEAFSRSATLTKSYAGRLIGILVVMFLCYWLLGLPADIVQAAMSKASKQAQLGAALGAQAWKALVLPLLAIAPVIYYFDMRCRKEGFDLAVLASSFGVDPNFIARLQASGRYSYDIPGYAPKGWDPRKHAVLYAPQAPVAAQGGNPFAYQAYAPHGVAPPIAQPQAPLRPPRKAYGAPKRPPPL